MKKRIHVRSYKRVGRLVPRSVGGLRAGSVILPPGGVMDWHSTQSREELVIAVSGQVHLEIQHLRRRRHLALSAGQCAFLPQETQHRVVNQASRAAQYLYVTAPASRVNATVSHGAPRVKEPVVPFCAPVERNSASHRVLCSARGERARG